MASGVATTAHTAPGLVLDQRKCEFAIAQTANVALAKGATCDNLHAIRKTGGTMITVDLDQSGQLTIRGVFHIQGLHRCFCRAQSKRHGGTFVSVQGETNFVNFIVAIYVENLLIVFSLSFWERAG